MKTDRKKLENAANGREYKIIKYVVSPYTDCYGCKALNYKRKQGILRQCGCGKGCRGKRGSRFGRNWKRFRLTQWRE